MTTADIIQLCFISLMIGLGLGALLMHIAIEHDTRHGSR